MVARQTRRRPSRRARATLVLALAVVPMSAGAASAASPVPLGTADSFALLAGSTITNTGSTTITGDIGLCCSGLAMPGFGSVTQPAGARYTGPGTVAATAQDDLDIAYANAAAQPVTSTGGVDLSLRGTPANPLLPGVYDSFGHGALAINTGLTLDFQGDPNAVFIFQATTLVTAVGAGGSVTIVNGGSTPSACNIYWQLSDATQGVTLGTGSAFKGTTMALGASVLGNSATVEGRILTRRSKAVTLDTNTISRSGCFTPTAGGAGSGATTTPPATTATPTVPNPAGTTPGPSGSVATRPVAAVLPGTAQIAGPEGAVSGPFAVTVTGRAIKNVVYSIDGRRVKTVNARQGRKKFKLMIDPRKQSRRLHRVTARVTFRTTSRTPKSTLRVRYRRVSAPRAPRFTG